MAGMIIEEPPMDLRGESIVISALDSYRPIFKNILSLNPRRIIDVLNLK